VTQGAKTAATLLVLLGLLTGGLAWGWSAATSPLPETIELAPCTSVGVEAGAKVYPDQVLVSVLNGGTREGLAGRTMQLFADAGFATGEMGNVARSGVSTAEVWASDPDGPSARLVASWLGKGTEIRTEETTAPGIVVVVGDEFEELAQGRKQVKAKADATICSPPTGE
jgi:hypothetical protein